jgi:hypothetical protein
MAEQLRGPFEKFADPPYYSESELCGGLFFVVLPLASDALLTTLHPLLEIVNGVMSPRTFQTAPVHINHCSYSSNTAYTPVRGIHVTV